MLGYIEAESRIQEEESSGRKFEKTPINKKANKSVQSLRQRTGQGNGPQLLNSKPTNL